LKYFEVTKNLKKNYATTWAMLALEKALASHEEITGTWPPRPVESDKWS